MTGDKDEGIKRIRLIASIIAAAMFGYTAVGQFQGQPGGVIFWGVFFSAVIGFVSTWVFMTIVKLVMKLIRK